MNETVEKKQWAKPVINQVLLQFDKDVVAACQTNSNVNAGAACNPGQSADALDKCN